MKTKANVILLFLALILNALSAHAEDKTFTSDGLIQDGDEYGNVFIYDTPPNHTTVDMFGGKIGNTLIYNSSIFNVWGGTTEVYANEESSINIYGGTIYTLMAYNSSSVNTNGGLINSLGSYDESVIYIYNGAQIGLLGSSDSGVVNVYSGIIDRISIDSFGMVNLHGGEVTDRIWANDLGITNVFGYTLSKISTGGSYGFGYVSGKWQDGTLFSIDFSGSQTYSRVILHEIPEPSMMILSILGLLCFRKHRT